MTDNMREIPSGKIGIESIALRVKGEIENISPIALGEGREKQMYPLGQQIRGAVGYLLMDMDLKYLRETYRPNGVPVMYFRDAFPIHGCKEGGKLTPLIRNETISDRGRAKIVKNTVYKCDKCADHGKATIVNLMVKKDKLINTHIEENFGDFGRTTQFANDVITEGTKFGLEIIVKTAKMGEIYSTEVGYLLKYIQENGIYLGKRTGRGLGKFAVRKLEIEKIGMEEISKRADQIYDNVNKYGVIGLTLLSDTIMGKQGTITGEDIIREAKNAAKFFDPHWSEYRDTWKDPIIKNTGKDMSGNTITETFLDQKVDENNGRVISQNMERCENLLPKGSSYSYQIDNKGVSSEVYNALAMAEMLRGIGKRTTFGKGQITIS